MLLEILKEICYNMPRKGKKSVIFYHGKNLKKEIQLELQREANLTVIWIFILKNLENFIDEEK